MKKLTVLLAIGFLVISQSSAVGEPDKDASSLVRSNNTVRAEFRIVGTDCPVCLNRIKNKLSALDGVERVSIWSWSPYFGVIVYDSKKVNWRLMEKAIEEEHVQFVDLKEQKSQ